MSESEGWSDVVTPDGRIVARRRFEGTRQVQESKCDLCGAYFTGAHRCETPESPRPSRLFETEDRTFRRHIHAWLEMGLEGKFVVVAGETIYGIFPSSRMAHGCAVLGLGGDQAMFLLREITAQEPYFVGTPPHCTIKHRPWGLAEG